ncbi:SDR family NAD(P)-dependent oxidoreductase [Natronomonas sp.]|uniref:SDR family NAD(P)-dependent oxidoreductase n=1 Tax=Natronomonas sp. TaxID=2184060 RepID=UPI003975EF6F
MARTVLVTGASGSIGRAICENVAGEWDVAAHYHADSSTGTEVVESVRSEGSDARSYRADLGDTEAAVGLVESVADDFGRLDGIVNNAGVFYDAPLDAYDDDMYQRTFGVNADGAIYATRAALSAMEANEPVDGVRGRVVSIASTAGVHGGPKDAIYAASKGALIAFTKSVARSRAADSILANVVAPGPTDTGMLPEERKELARDAIPLGRLATPEEIAEVVRDGLETSFMTGQVLELNGGLYT